MQSTNQPPQPMIEILSRVAHELRDLAASTDGLHCLVDNIKWESIVEKHALMQSAQALDVFEQRLSGLSDFIFALADLMPSQWEVEGHVASRKVKLTALAVRLANQPSSPSTINQHIPGDLEFF
ncbi:MAG: hypothetical protein HYS06_02140 [Methylocystis sp.]|nr:hypothetical protein [Methylocystis sp.]